MGCHMLSGKVSTRNCTATFWDTWRFQTLCKGNPRQSEHTAIQMWLWHALPCICTQRHSWHLLPTWSPSHKARPSAPRNRPFRGSVLPIPGQTTIPNPDRRLNPIQHWCSRPYATGNRQQAICHLLQGRRSSLQVGGGLPKAALPGAPSILGQAPLLCFQTL